MLVYYICTLVDNLNDGDGNALALTAGPVFTSTNANSIQGNIKVGEVATYTATYTICSKNSCKHSVIEL